MIRWLLLALWLLLMHFWHSTGAGEALLRFSLE
jgi:hypothetical protein